jgi:hypothetical protein
MSEVENQQELTAEQIAEYRKTSLSFYKDRISFMKVQLEYEQLSADIEEAKLKALMARLKMAHITAPPQEGSEEESQKPE